MFAENVIVKIPIGQGQEKTDMKRGIEISPKAQYGLKLNFFDPAKSSPPNDFLSKLKMRINTYNNTYQIDKKCDNFDNE
jgi:hypothetical protein